MKTVLARMREISDYGKTLDDGMNVSRVEGALKSIGIQLRDTSGQFRDMEEVLKEVGMSWDTLNKNQQASVAVALAGTRQQSRLLAIFQDFDRTLELVDESQESAGATNAQHQEYMKSMEAALTRLQTAWQQFITTITDSEIIIDIINGISWVVEGFASILEKMSISGKNAMIAIAALMAVLQSKAIIMKTLTILGFAETASIRKNIALTWQEVTAKASKVAVDKADNLQKQKRIDVLWSSVNCKIKKHRCNFNGYDCNGS